MLGFKAPFVLAELSLLSSEASLPGLFKISMVESAVVFFNFFFFFPTWEVICKTADSFNDKPI